MPMASSPLPTAAKMASRPKNSLGPLVLFHGCDKDVAESVLRGEATLQPSENDYDWLGNGIYFWVDSPERALAWAKLRRSTPSVVGAFVYPGNCLNLTDYGVMNELALAYEATVGISAAAGTPLPVNSARQNGIFMKRQLDCAVIQLVHKIRESKGMDAYDTVYGVFEEGDLVYPGAGFRDRTHVQIAIRNPEMILGYFRVNSMT